MNSKEYYQNNKIKIIEQRKKYYKTEKEKRSKLKKALKDTEDTFNVKHDFTYDEWLEKVKATKGICSNPLNNPLCMGNVGINNLTRDHNPPISKVPKGFVYYINAMKPICLSCNSSKGCKEVEA